MFEFLSSITGESGLHSMESEFCGMLRAGCRTFDTAVSTLIDEADPSTVRKDLFKTERAIDEAERQIRRKLIVHATVHGASSFATCLVFMSIVKDAERLGDYASNIFDLTVQAGPIPEGQIRTDLSELKNRIVQLMEGCLDAFTKQDEDAANRLIEEAEKIEDYCDSQIAIILERTGMAKPGIGTKRAASALAYRYFKRTSSHVLNILTSIVQPVDMLDYSATS